MSEMIERVARAIFEGGHSPLGGRMSVWDAQGELTRGLYHDAARAAIEAMREPTVEMTSAGDAQDDGTDSRAPSVWHWKAMIDAALKDHDRG